MLISPNASQVAKVLRGGIAGIALSYAVKQLLGAVDWVLDPANNQIKYKDKPTVVCTDKLSCIPPSSQYYFTIRFAFVRETISFFGKTPEEIHQSVFGYWRTVNTIYRWTTIGSCKVSGECEYYNVLYGSERVSTIQYFRVKNPAYDPNTQNQEKTLSLITVAQQVIENAESDNLDAQFAVLAAAQDILNEAEQDDAKAKPYEDELERNADDKCRIHNAYMNGQARIIEDRYNEMFVDTYDLYNKYFSIKNPLQGVGSWEGHIYRYVQVEQPILRQRILDAVLAGCYETPNASRWKQKSPPPKPGVHSPG